MEDVQHVVVVPGDEGVTCLVGGTQGVVSRHDTHLMRLGRIVQHLENTGRKRCE